MIYAAKSTEDKHGSIPTQLEDCRQMAEREGWTVVGESTTRLQRLSRQPWPGARPGRSGSPASAETLEREAELAVLPVRGYSHAPTGRVRITIARWSWFHVYRGSFSGR